jgi:hypothetical protein
MTPLFVGNRGRPKKLRELPPSLSRGKPVARPRDDVLLGTARRSRPRGTEVKDREREDMVQQKTDSDVDDRIWKFAAIP